MKKLLALALAVVMMMAIALPTFAAVAVPNESISYRDGEHNDASDSADYLEDENDQTSNEVEIEYGVAQAYTVTIPADINLHQFITDRTNETVVDGKKDGMVYGMQTVEVEDVVLAKGETLRIRLTSAATDTDAKAWKLLDTESNNLTGGTAANSDFVNYVIKVDDADAVNTANYISTEIDYAAIADTYLAEGGVILECAAATGNVSTIGSENLVYLYFSSNGTAQEGTYKDFLTFTVSIEA